MICAPPDLDADLFTGLPDRCLRRRLADLDGAAKYRPSVVMTSVPDEQQAPSRIDRKHRNGRQQEEVVPYGGPQPRDVRRDTHRGVTALSGRHECWPRDRLGGRSALMARYLENPEGNRPDGPEVRVVPGHQRADGSTHLASVNVPGGHGDRNIARWRRA